METRPNGWTRDTVVAAILHFLSGHDPNTVNDFRAALEHEIEAAGQEAVTTLQDRLSADTTWDYYPRDPLAQRIHHLLAERFLTADSMLFGAQHLAGIRGGRLTILANHLSYADANVIEIMLQRAGHAATANRLTAIAGPKVFTSRERRFSSLCFGTIKVPQSTEVSSDEAVLNPREVARAARRAIEVARQRLCAGDALILFGEGTRSRGGGMQPMLAGVARYLDVPDTWVLPTSLAGSENLFPVGEATLRPAAVTMQFGTPIRAEDLLANAGGDRRIVMDAIGLAVAEVALPPYRGVYADQGNFSDACEVLRRSRGEP